MKIFSSLSDGFPRVYDFFKSGGRDCIVMELVGPVVAATQRIYGGGVSRAFPLETVGSLAIQMIDRMETMHTAGYVHGDLFKNNISPGRGRQYTLLYAIDFGQVSKISSSGKAKSFDAKSTLFSVLSMLGVGDKYSDLHKYVDNPSQLKNVPKEVRELAEYISELEGDDDPDYDYMRSLMKHMVASEGLEYSGSIIWPKIVQEKIA
jgi:serine/threonine protein kinase